MRILFFLIILFTLPSIGAEEESLLEERRDTLNYGIDSEVLSLIDTFVEEDFKELDDDLFSILTTTETQKIRHRLFDYFRDTDNSAAIEYSGSLLKLIDDYDKVSILKALDYLAHFENKDYVLDIYELVDDADKQFKRKAIWVLGKLKATEYYEDFQVMWDDEELDRPTRDALLQAIADMGVADSIDFFSEIVEDEDADSTEKKIAIGALGSIGTQDALNGLLPLLESDQIFLRLESTSALLAIDNPDSTRLLMRALRDSYWRIRVKALEGLSTRGAMEAGPIILYKAKRDPENRVRMDALKALALLGYPEGLQYMRDFLEDTEKSEHTRQIIADLLIRHDLDASYSVFEKVIEERWDKKEDKLLDVICKGLAIAETGLTSDLYGRLLEHEYFIIQLYGLRGIRINGLGRYKEKVVEMTKEPFHPAVIKAAISTLGEI